MFFAESCSQLRNWFTVCNQPSPAQPAMQLARCGSCSMHRPFWRIAVPGRKILLHLACTACSSRCADHRSASSAELSCSSSAGILGAAHPWCSTSRFQGWVARGALGPDLRPFWSFAHLVQKCVHAPSLAERSPRNQRFTFSITTISRSRLALVAQMCF